MRVTTLSLTDFRCYARAELALTDGMTVVLGANGAGKTSLLEALAWAALGRSFRGVPDAALVRGGAGQAVLRLCLETAERRERFVEAEIRAAGRNRVLLDHHPIKRTRDLFGCLRATVFAPDDLALVKGGPVGRRTYLDDLLVATAPRFDGVRREYEEVLRHRNALLKADVRSGDARETLAVFDEQLVRAGAELVAGRLRLVARLTPALDAAYRALAPATAAVGATYQAPWAEEWRPDEATVADALERGLAALRRREIERGLTLVGPHRDEWHLSLAGLDSRTHASQGEQRTLALAMRLAGHRLCADVLGDAPLLLLDDVFSELDPERAAALVRELPTGQTIVTTAGVLPPSVHPERRVRVAGGELVEP